MTSYLEKKPTFILSFATLCSVLLLCHHLYIFSDYIFDNEEKIGFSDEIILIKNQPLIRTNSDSNASFRLKGVSYNSLNTSKLVQVQKKTDGLDKSEEKKSEELKISLITFSKPYNFDSLCIPIPDIYEGQKVYKSVDKIPEFVTGEAGMIKYISDNISYPINSDNIQSKLVASFLIDTFGMVRNVCISKSHIKGSITEMERSFLNILDNMPTWKPGILNRKKVVVRMLIPVRVCYR